MADEAPENEELILTDEVEQEAPEAETPEEEDEIPTFGDEPEEVAQTEALTFRHIREKLAETQAELAKTRRKLLEGEKPIAKPVTREELGPEPLLENFDFDEDRFKVAHKEWVRAEVRIEDSQGKSTEQQQAQVEATRKRIEKEKIELARPDVDDAFETVRDTLTDFQQSMLVATIDDGNTAKLIYALAKNPDRLASLAGITDAPRFIKEIAKLEGSLKMVKRRAPIAPDTPERGSGRVSTGGSSEKQLARLNAKAQESGDYTEYLNYKRQLK